MKLKFSFTDLCSSSTHCVRPFSSEDHSTILETNSFTSFFIVRCVNSCGKFVSSFMTVPRTWPQCKYMIRNTIVTDVFSTRRFKTHRSFSTRTLIWIPDIRSPSLTSDHYFWTNRHGAKPAILGHRQTHDIPSRVQTQINVFNNAHTNSIQSISVFHSSSNFSVYCLSDIIKWSPSPSRKITLRTKIISSLQRAQYDIPRRRRHQWQKQNIQTILEKDKSNGSRFSDTQNPAFCTSVVKTSKHEASISRQLRKSSMCRNNSSIWSTCSVSIFTTLTNAWTFTTYLFRKNVLRPSEMRIQTSRHLHHPDIKKNTSKKTLIDTLIILIIDSHEMDYTIHSSEFWSYVITSMILVIRLPVNIVTLLHPDRFQKTSTCTCHTCQTNSFSRAVSNTSLLFLTRNLCIDLRLPRVNVTSLHFFLSIHSSSLRCVAPVLHKSLVTTYSCKPSSWLDLTCFKRLPSFVTVISRNLSFSSRTSEYWDSRHIHFTDESNRSSLLLRVLSSSCRTRKNCCAVIKFSFASTFSSHYLIFSTQQS